MPGTIAASRHCHREIPNSAGGHDVIVLHMGDDDAGRRWRAAHSRGVPAAPRWKQVELVCDDAVQVRLLLGHVHQHDPRVWRENKAHVGGVQRQDIVKQHAVDSNT